MEEDIKILEEFKINGYSMLLMRYGDRNTTNLKLERAIENLIKAYKELEEDNKHLLSQGAKQIADTDINYIPKSLIKEKIEEIEQSKTI